MKNRAAASALFLSAAALSAGCGETRDGYVDFDKTAPAATDPQPFEKKPAPELKSETVEGAPAAPASDATPETSAVTHAVSKVDSPGSLDADAETAPVTRVAATAGAAGTPETNSPLATDAAGEKMLNATPKEEPKVVVSAQSGLSGLADTPVVENSAASEPRKIELLIPDRHLRKERGTNALRVTYDDVDLLKVLNMEPVPIDAIEYFPEWLKSLDGKPIRIRGFMYPTFEATGLTSFTLARDNGICCFVRQPKIYDIIGVTLADGVTTDYIEGRPFDVEGTFHIEPQADEKDLSRLYRIDNARVLH